MKLKGISILAEEAKLYYGNKSPKEIITLLSKEFTALENNEFRKRVLICALSLLKGDVYTNAQLKSFIALEAKSWALEEVVEQSIGHTFVVEEILPLPEPC